MASKNMVEEQRPYASKKEAAIHTTVTVELHNIFQKVAHKKNLTMAQAARAAILVRQVRAQLDHAAQNGRLGRIVAIGGIELGSLRECRQGLLEISLLELLLPLLKREGGPRLLRGLAWRQCNQHHGDRYSQHTPRDDLGNLHETYSLS